MSRRKIVTIHEELCNGCGRCVTACAEGALRIVNGKARLVSERFCDGFGDCIGQCPTGALKIQERECVDVDEQATRRHVLELGGPEALRRMEAAAEAHAHREAHATVGPPTGCPGLRVRAPTPTATAPADAVRDDGLPARVLPSELRQWPVQIHLVHPGAAFFANRELVVLSTCSPIASADVHWRFIRGRAVVVGCPKLDRTEGYPEKLASILSNPTIPRVIVVRMEVPCCGGLTAIVLEAARRCGRTDLEVAETVISVDGAVRSTKTARSRQHK